MKSRRKASLLIFGRQHFDHDHFLGLVSKIFEPEKVLPEAIKLAEKISSHSQIIVGLCKESVNRAYETTLQEGLNFERKMFQATFATVSYWSPRPVSRR